MVNKEIEAGERERPADRPRTPAVAKPAGRPAGRTEETVRQEIEAVEKTIAELEVRHRELTEKLIRVRKEVVETEKGYEFQYGPADVTLAELAEWVVAEGKCCPFFDFHIDLEREGALLCLRLTGEEGIKAFIRTEFPVVQK